MMRVEKVMSIENEDIEGVGYSIEDQSGEDHGDLDWEQMLPLPLNS